MCNWKLIAEMITKTTSKSTHENPQKSTAKILQSSGIHKEVYRKVTSDY